MALASLIFDQGSLSNQTMQLEVTLALTLTLSPRLSITHNFSRRIIILYLYLNGLCIL